ncbi:MAG: EutN/CcmL family microcompartment protein [Bacteroidota bacterium]|jgi:microcompartment protein CcmK/EutM
MKIGKVIGRVVSTRKEGNVEGLPILVVSYLDETLSDTGKTAACIDTVNAGDGDVVLLCASSSARMTSRTTNVATDNTIVGIVDSVSAGSKYVYRKSKSGADQ